MAIYAQMMGIEEMMLDPGFADFVLSLPDDLSDRLSTKEVWDLYTSQN